MEEEIFQLIKELQFKSWWFNGRRKIIEAFMKNNFSKKNLEILDIGSGYGGAISLLKKFGYIDVIEPNEKTHPQLYKLGIRDIFQIADFPQNCPKKKYDIVTMFDVLEHLKNDTLALKVVKDNLLKLHGRCFITVPSYPGLWTEVDDKAGHFRRYTLGKLKKLMKNTGFQNIKISYFMCILFPIDILARISVKTNKDKHFNLEYAELNPKVSKIMESIFSYESKLISGIRFPYGTSIIAKGEV